MSAVDEKFHGELLARHGELVSQYTAACALIGSLASEDRADLRRSIRENGVAASIERRMAEIRER